MVKPAKGRSSSVYIAAAILVVVLLVSATLLLLYPSGSAKTLRTTVVTTTTATETSTATSTSTEYIALNESGDADLLADCVSSQVNAPWFGTLVAGTSSPAILCLQLYEFGSNSTILVNASSLLSIQGLIPHQGGGFESDNAPQNFTVSASQDQLLMGGPSNSNEGTIVAYSILASPGSSGTYTLGIQGGKLTSGSPDGCASFGELVAGDGQPDYALIGGCITTNPSDFQPSFTIPGVGYNVAGDALYFRIVSITNSTQ
jgi:hypothetical protein